MQKWTKHQTKHWKMSPKIITAIYVRRTPLQSSIVFWNYTRLEKQGRMWDINVCMLCRMYFNTKHKQQIHLCLKRPQFLWKKPPICWGLYIAVHGHKHYGCTCCLHSELKGGAQIWHTHADRVFASGNKAAVLTPTAIYFCILDVHMPCMFHTHIS